MLSEYFLEKFRQNENINVKRISLEVIEVLKNYSWPGNIRELKSVIYEACANARKNNEKIIKMEHLKREILLTKIERQDKNKNNNLDFLTMQLELRKIDGALMETRGIKRLAAETLGWNADKILNRVKKFSEHIIGCDDYFYIKKYYKLK